MFSSFFMRVFSDSNSQTLVEFIKAKKESIERAKFRNRIGYYSDYQRHKGIMMFALIPLFSRFERYKSNIFKEKKYEKSRFEFCETAVAAYGGDFYKFAIFF